MTPANASHGTIRTLLPKLEFGAAARLEVEGVLRVLPAETTADLYEASPVAADGTYRGILAEAHEAREDAIVRRMLARGGTQFLIMGQAHDLTDNAKRAGAGYVRVRVKGLGQAVGR